MTELEKAAPSNHGPIHETDLYDFAGWLTTRPGVMTVGSSCEAGPMAEAVGEYIKTFPERFALTQRPAALAQALAPTEHLVYEDGSPGPKLHSPEGFAAKRQDAADRITSMPEAMRQNMHYAAATMPAHTERKGEPVELNLWCKTCQGSGQVYEEHQISIPGAGGDRECPDCGGKGYVLTNRYQLAAGDTSPQVPEDVPWKGLNLDVMADAFHQLIEAQVNRESPFFNPITKNAQLALREFKLCIPAMQAIDAARKEPRQ